MLHMEPLQVHRTRRLRQTSTLKTLEPDTNGQAQPPSSPRLRFRLRRRTASNLRAPTQQFLASVAAADVPMLSIEEPQVYDEDVLGLALPEISRLERLGDVASADQMARGRTFSPPKTPAPDFAPTASSSQFPDWSVETALSSLESSSEYESSRPSTARSTQTSASLFSRFSVASDDLSQCDSPESEFHERVPGQFPFPLPFDADKTVRPTATHPHKSVKSRRAPWTKAMSQHLWSTYLTYLQDPKVTPFRVGRSGIPPSGVCMRVAREAKRSWKGSRTLAKPEGSGSGSGSGRGRSRSCTPTAELGGSYIEWPHTCAATRAQLRELCKAHSGSATRHLPYLSGSSTALLVGKAANRLCSRRTMPARSPSVFSSAELAMSLAVCTSDSMQPQGPLAQLALTDQEQGVPSFGRRHLEQPTTARLGSPFTAQSYGPSSSSSALRSNSPRAQRQARTVGTRRSLGSPVQLDQPRPGTQKRRSRQSAWEPRRIKRPSLGSDFWTDPSSQDGAEVEAEPNRFSSTGSYEGDNMFVPRANLQELFEASCFSVATTSAANVPSAAAALSTSHTAPARLGSPFSARPSSHSFPSRHSSAASIDLGSIFRPFATVHRTGNSAAVDTTAGGGGGGGGTGRISASSVSSMKRPLVSRLAYIDERLKDFRRREKSHRRSQSPC